MWRCGETPEKVHDVQKHGHKEQNIWKELTKEKKKNTKWAVGAFSTGNTDENNFFFKKKASSVCINIWELVTLCSHRGES